jgi:glycosyltransferase involved in cell wall biosynthesis
MVIPNLVSVIIPNYNYAEYLRESIDSVLNQDYQAIEVIVVDDGSTDGSLEILKSYGSQIKVIEITNSGAPTARNFGLMISQGRYIAYLDADDYWVETKISSQVRRLLETKTDLVYCKMTVLDIDANTRTVSEVTREGSFKNEFLLHPARTPFSPSTALMTRDLVARAGIWDTTFKSPAEDFDYFRRCAKFTDIAIVDEALVIHRNHSKSLTSESLSRYYEDNRLGLIKLFADEYPFLSFLARRKSWIKLNIVFAKSFLKSARLVSFGRCILACILPINF